MGETKIYPSTQAQVAAVDAKLDVINNKLPLPQYQIKTVNPSGTQQTITPDNNYTALSGVVVNPISASMPENLEDFVMRKGTIPEFSLSLNGDVPDYACYQQKKLVAVYGSPTSIGNYAFSNCSSLQDINWGTIISVRQSAFQYCSSIYSIESDSIISIGYYGFDHLANLTNVTLKNCTTLGERTFTSNALLETVDLRSATHIPARTVENCSQLKYFDCRNTTTIDHMAFSSCTSLLLIDITNSHAVALGNSNNIPNNANLTILVADATDKAYYQSATNWSTHASKIKTVAEYEQEIGMTYDEYYLQVFGHARNEVTE